MGYVTDTSCLKERSKDLIGQHRRNISYVYHSAGGEMIQNGREGNGL